MGPTKKFFFCDFETTGVDYDKDYPIEIGGLFLDSNFKPFYMIDEIISWRDLTIQEEMVDGDKFNVWKPEYEFASTIHHISADEYERKGMPAYEVCQELIGFAEIMTDIPLKKDESDIIIISDCPNFEYRFLQLLFKKCNYPFPFHYCAWSTSLLDHIKGRKYRVSPHRAYPDTTSEYGAFLKNLVEVGFVTEEQSEEYLKILEIFEKVRS